MLTASSLSQALARVLRGTAERNAVRMDQVCVRHVGAPIIFVAKSVDDTE
jgi:hypothetical protein